MRPWVFDIHLALASLRLSLPEPATSPEMDALSLKRGRKYNIKIVSTLQSWNTLVPL